MSEKIKRGREGERLAEALLREKGFQVVARNYRYRRSEIDLIVQRDNWLVFIEVKTRTSNAFGYPEEFVDRHQKKRIIGAAVNYMYDSEWQGNARYDIVAVDLSGSEPQLRHIEDAFY